MWAYRLGIPVVILSGITGASIFSTLEQQTGLKFKIALGITSILVTIFAGLQTFLRFPERAAEHMKVSSKLGSIRREIEQLLNNPPEKQKEFDKRISELRKQIDEADNQAPILTYFIKMLGGRFQALCNPNPF